MDVPVKDAEGRLNELLDRAAAGEDIVLTRDGQSVAQLTPLSPVRTPPTPEEVARRVRAIREIQDDVRRKFAGREMPTSDHSDMYDEFGQPK